MRNTYNKGAYRSGEWGKHLRPYLKKNGNRRWRRDLAKVIREEMADGLERNRKRKRSDKDIVVKYKTLSYGNNIRTCTGKYRSMKAAQNAMQMNKVIWATILNEHQ